MLDLHKLIRVMTTFVIAVALSGGLHFSAATLCAFSLRLNDIALPPGYIPHPFLDD